MDHFIQLAALTISDTKIENKNQIKSVHYVQLNHIRGKEECGEIEYFWKDLNFFGEFSIYVKIVNFNERKSGYLCAIN